MTEYRVRNISEYQDGVVSCDIDNTLVPVMPVTVGRSIAAVLASGQIWVTSPVQAIYRLLDFPVHDPQKRWFLAKTKNSWYMYEGASIV